MKRKSVTPYSKTLDNIKQHQKDYIETLRKKAVIKQEQIKKERIVANDYFKNVR